MRWSNEHHPRDVADFLDDMCGAEGEVLGKVEMFLRVLPDRHDTKYALEAVREDMATLKRLTAFRKACGDDDAEDRILGSIRLRERLRQLRTPEEVLELMVEMGVTS